jgi:uncharacterized protein YbdZ (MbtH family)
MKEFKINEEQIQSIWNVLVKVPAGEALPAIDTLRGLALIPVEKKEEKKK